MFLEATKQHHVLSAELLFEDRTVFTVPESGTQAQRLNGRPFHSLTRKLSQMVQFALYHMLLPLLCIIEFSNLILEPIELS